MAPVQEALAVEEAAGPGERLASDPRVPGEAPSPPRLPRARALRRPARALARLLPARPAPRSPRRGLLRAPGGGPRADARLLDLPRQALARQHHYKPPPYEPLAPTLRASVEQHFAKSNARQRSSAERSGRERKCRSEATQSSSASRRVGPGVELARVEDVLHELPGLRRESPRGPRQSTRRRWPGPRCAASARRSSSYLRRSLRR